MNPFTCFPPVLSLLWDRKKDWNYKYWRSRAYMTNVNYTQQFLKHSKKRSLWMTNPESTGAQQWSWWVQTATTWRQQWKDQTNSQKCNVPHKTFIKLVSKHILNMQVLDYHLSIFPFRPNYIFPYFKRKLQFQENIPNVPTTSDLPFPSFPYKEHYFQFQWGMEQCFSHSSGQLSSLLW